MAKAKKRKPDLRRVRPTKTYSLQEIAQTLDRDIATVRRWAGAGLPKLDDRKPVLVHGEDLRTWLKARWAAGKRKCAPGELLCMRCRTPQKPKPGSVSLHPRNEKTLTIKALCGKCGTRMNQAASGSRATEIAANFRAQTTEMQHLIRFCEIGL